MAHPACMLDMEMGTGKTRVAIDVSLARKDVTRVLVVCPKAVLPVWASELEKHADRLRYECWTKDPKASITKGACEMREFMAGKPAPAVTKFAIVNYDSVWRGLMGDVVQSIKFDMIILDESHRIKAAGSKVSKFFGMIGKRVKYKLCLSGTPMANSPLDVYGQYRFLDSSLFGTNHSVFLQNYAIMSLTSPPFVVGVRNQHSLMEKYNSIAYTCKMSDVADRLKLPEALPPVQLPIQLPARDMGTLRKLAKEFIAECSTGGMIVLNNVLTRTLRMQQITSGFCKVQDDPASDAWVEDLNSAKEDALVDILGDIDANEQVVVFCVFQHDLDAIASAALKCKRRPYELSGRDNGLEMWKKTKGAVLAVQIQAGAEGVDMTCANHAVYFSLPHSLALYDQSKARLYRPNQKRPVSFVHLVAVGTIDEVMYDALLRKKDLIGAIKDGSVDFGRLK